MSEHAVDVAILFALDEEFDVFSSLVEVDYRPDDDPQTGRTYFLFDAPTQSGPPYRCIAVSVGAMGAQAAGQLTTTIRQRYSPRTIVVVGLAGSLSSDVRVPDVVVADVVDDYLQNAKAEGETLSFSLSGEVYRPHVRLTNVIRNLRWRHQSVWEKLSRAGVDDVQQILAELRSMNRADSNLETALRADDFQVQIGHLASGSTVVASEAFRQWLIGRDRKYLAVEMETAGVTNALYHGAGDERLLVLRAVSDLSDERKKALDSLNGGLLRRVAMRNAIRVMLVLLEIGAFERGPTPAREGPDNPY